MTVRAKSRVNPIRSAAQYGLAQAVASGTARSKSSMTPTVAREMIERTPAKMRERFAKELAKRRNPADGAASLYEMFHGGPSEGVLTVHEDVHIHEHLGELGVLGGLKLRTVNGYDIVLEFIQDKANNPRKDIVEKVGGKTKGWLGRRTKALGGLADRFARTWLNPRGEGPVILCSNEIGDSMYLRGGDQSLDLGALHLGQFKKDSIVIGEVWLLGYLTEKSFDDWKELFYVHGLGDEKAHPKIGKKKDLWDDARPPERLFGTGNLPTLIYDRLSCLLSFSGGVYKIKAEGITD